MKTQMTRVLNSPLGFAIYAMLVVGYVMTAFAIENRVFHVIGGVFLWSIGFVAYRAKKKDNAAGHRPRCVRSLHWRTASGAGSSIRGEAARARRYAIAADGSGGSTSSARC